MTSLGVMQKLSQKSLPNTKNFIMDKYRAWHIEEKRMFELLSNKE